MRTATAATVTALQELIKQTGSQRKAAAIIGTTPIAVSDAVRGRPVSHERENVLRAGMGLEPLLPERVVIITDAQRIVAAPGHGKRRPYSKRLSVYVTAENEESVAAFIAATGAGTFNGAFWRFVTERPDLGHTAGG